MTRSTRIITCCLLLLAGVAATGAAVLAATAGPAHSSPTSAPGWLVTLAQQEAAINGGSPTSAQYALTSMAVAAPSVGLPAKDLAEIQVNPTLQVYLVVMTGHFVATHAFLPLGASTPTGTTLVFTVDAHTHLVHDFGLGDEPANTVTVADMSPLTL